MSVLLRQAHGFEGVLPRLVHDHSLDCSVVDGPNPRDSDGHLDSVTSPQVAGVGHHYEIARFDELVWLDPKGLPVPGEVLLGSSYPDQG